MVFRQEKGKPQHAYYHRRTLSLVTLKLHALHYPMSMTAEKRLELIATPRAGGQY
jgi:hypothetical protein